jgi:hypothetical protein
MYERALDASMAVALGKVFLFKECWDYLSKRARKEVRQKKVEGLRVSLSEPTTCPMICFSCRLKLLYRRRK